MKLSKREFEALKQPERHVKFKHGYIDVNDVIDMYKSGASINYISFELGAPERLIRNILVANKMSIRNQSQAAIARFQRPVVQH